MDKTEKIAKIIDENAEEICKLMDNRDYKGVNDLFSSVSNINIYTERPDQRASASNRENKYFLRFDDLRNGKYIKTRLIGFINPENYRFYYEYTGVTK